MRYTKRRMDFLVSRWTAKEAIASALGWGGALAVGARIEVRNRPTGAPEAYVDGEPLGVEISLTDRAGWAVCLVGPDRRHVGCDLELVEPRSSLFVRDYFTDEEQRRAAAAADGERDALVNLVWSAKESALKVLGTGLRRDTRSVEVFLHDDPLDQAWSALTVHTREGLSLPGWWRRFDQFLLTVAAEEPTPPPAALEDPPALLAATPTHGWMTRPV
jgi:4'-phosphopantetheinyl transferase